MRAHPWPTLRHALYNQPKWWLRAVAVLDWLARLGPLAGRDSRELVRALSIADATVVETRSARDAVHTSLERQAAIHLGERLHVIPNPVAEAFVEGAVVPGRDKLVLAVGRWDLAAKDARLMDLALARFLRRRPDYRAVVIGGGAEGRFRAQVERAGHMSHQDIRTLMGRARMVVTSSHWESFSLASHEGLAMGCSVVGPRLQPLRDIVASGPFGTLAERRSSAGLAGALVREAAAWDEGRRDASRTAAHWRPLLTIEGVARRYASLLPALPVSSS